MANIKTDNTIVMLINLLNQEGISLEAYCGIIGKIKAASNATEGNLQSSTEAGNNHIDIHTNNMVVDNDIQSQASWKDYIEDNEVQRQALWQETEDNKVQRQASCHDPVEVNEVQRQALRQEPGHVSQKTSKK